MRQIANEAIGCGGGEREGVAPEEPKDDVRALVRASGTGKMICTNH
jgi:hypothetical protein